MRPRQKILLLTLIFSVVGIFIVYLNNRSEASTIQLERYVPESLTGRYAPFSSTSVTPITINTPIVIKDNDDEACRSDTLLALQLLSDKAPDAYTTVTKYISTIECVSSGSGMYAYENPPRFAVGAVARDRGTISYASSIVHDAWHSKLYIDYKTSHTGSAVPDSIWTGKDAEIACLNAQAESLAKLDADQITINHIKNSINTNYWLAPLSDRWW